MNAGEVQDLFRDLLLTASLVALPALAVSLVVGIVVSIVQTVTSIQDQTLGYVPRTLLVGLTLVVTLAFSLELAVDFTRRMLMCASGAGG